jgi:hypothetical protein
MHHGSSSTLDVTWYCFVVPSTWFDSLLSGFLLAPMGFDKICMMTTRLACNRAIESSYWRMDNDSDVGLLMGYVLYWLPVVHGFGYLSPLIRIAPFSMHKLIRQDTAVLHQAIIV